jgi:hypothetical protein
VDTVDIILDEFALFQDQFPDLAKRLEEFFAIRPYFIYCFFLEIAR